MGIAWPLPRPGYRFDLFRSLFTRNSLMQFDTHSLPSPEALKHDMATSIATGGGAALPVVTGVLPVYGSYDREASHLLHRHAWRWLPSATLGIRRLTKDPNAASKETINVTPLNPTGNSTCCCLILNCLAALAAGLFFIVNYICLYTCLTLISAYRLTKLVLVLLAGCVTTFLASAQCCIC